MGKFRYGSVCSGIEAASVAWKPLGWECAWLSEIDPFPCAVLAHHYPDVPNLGDMTKITKEQLDGLGRIDLLVGGTPCQSFSVAGLRKGLDDPHGNLALEFLRIADAARPEWVLWENVPGVLSSLSHNAPDPRPPDPPVGMGLDGTLVETTDEYESEEVHALYCFLGALAELGYGWSYRVLDAQYVRVDGFGRAVPQRRRRVFVVGHLGDWRRAAAVLFEQSCLSGDSAPSREAGQGLARSTSGSVRSSGPGFARAGDSRGQDAVVAAPLTSKPYADHESQDSKLIAHSLLADGFDASEDGTGRGTPIVTTAFSYIDDGRDASEGVTPTMRVGTSLEGGKASGGVGGNLAAAIAFDTTQVTSDKNYSKPKPGDPCHPLAGTAHPPAVAYTIHGTDKTAKVASVTDVAGAVRTKPPGSVENSSTTVALAYVNPRIPRNSTTSNQVGIKDGSSSDTLSSDGPGSIITAMAVRRLTPTECERLQGFPDNFTLVDYRGKAAKDGPRYRALGNSMAVNGMRWIGMRITPESP